MDKLREATAKALRRPVNDSQWAWLKDNADFGYAEMLLRDEGAQYLASVLRDAQRRTPNTPSGRVPVEVRDAAFNARTDALSAIFAEHAAHESDVEMFRRRMLPRLDAEAMRAYGRGGPHPGVALLGEEAVEPWIRDQYDHLSETGDGEDEIRRLIGGWTQGSELPVVDLQYVHSGAGRLLTVPRSGCLGDLQKYSEKLASRYRWHPAWAANFILTGTEPLVATYAVSAQLRLGAVDSVSTRITLELDPTLSVKQVAELYAGIRGQLAPETPRRLQALKSYRLAEHVGPHLEQVATNSKPEGHRGRPRKTTPPGGVLYYVRPGGGHTWRSLMCEWNQMYADRGEDGSSWRYGELSNFTKDVLEIMDRLMNPRWGMKNLPRRSR